MRTVLQRDGDEYVLRIDKKTFEDWAIDPEAPMELTAEAGRVVLLPAEEGEVSRKIDDAMEVLMKRYDKTFKRLSK